MIARLLRRVGVATGAAVIVMCSGSVRSQEPPSAEPQRVWVTARANQPVSGATIEVWPTMESAGSGESRRFETDELGRAYVSIPPGWKAMTAFKEGVGRSAVVESWRSFIKLVEVQRVRGQVLWMDGKPEPGAIVHGADVDPHATGMAMYDQSLPSNWRKATAVTTDADGFFEIELAGDGFEELDAESRGQITPGRSPALAGLLDGSLVLRFAGGYRISGRVVPFSAPGETKVYARDGSSLTDYTADVSADGTFTVLIAEPDTIPIHAVSAGWVQDNEVVVELSETQTTATVELKLVAAGAVSGRVTSPEKSIAGLKAVSDDIWDRHMASPYDDPWAAMLSAAHGQALADPTGHFTLRGLNPRLTYTLYIDPPWAKFQVLARGVSVGATGLDLVVQP